MNAGKRGRPFQYPEPFIVWMARIHGFLQMPYRQMEVFVQITDESVPDDRVFVPLLDQIQQHCGKEHPVHRVLGRWGL
jgi:hypothetical protein